VNALRFVIALLPQLLTLMLVGARFDLLGGLNRTDTGTNILMLLFLLTPVATATLLVVEVWRRRSRNTDDRALASDRSGQMVALADAPLREAAGDPPYPHHANPPRLPDLSASRGSLGGRSTRSPGRASSRGR